MSLIRDLPKASFRVANSTIDWRKYEDETDDDEIGVSADVIGMLGFDPTQEDEEEE